jgi:SAM-dependent methyltransferase
MQVMKAQPARKATSGRDFLESVCCFHCGSSEFQTLLPSRYPSNLTYEDLVRIYKSSSDLELMDPLVKCQKCQMVFLNPRPIADLVVDSYAQAEDAVFISQNASRIASFSSSLKSVAKRVGLKKGAKILDIGSAGGAFLKAAVDLGYQATGVEPNRSLSAFARKEYGVDLRTGTLESQSFPPQSFDAISLWDVLEHVHRPDDMLNHCRRLLKKDGVLLINFPDYGSWVSRLMGRHWPFLLGVHLYYFTRKSLNQTLKKAGFKTVGHWPHWQRLELGYILKRASAKLPFLSRVAALLPGPLARLSVPYQLGQTLTVAKVNE